MGAPAPSLDELSLWREMKYKIWYQDTPVSNTIHNIMRTVRAIHSPSGLAYITCPITSSKYLYELQEANPGTPKNVLLAQAMNYNYNVGYGLLQDLLTRLSLPILYPADVSPVFEAWDQIHFQALWLNLIAEKCTEVHLVEDWEFSNGSCEEVTHVFQLRLGLPTSMDNFLFFNTKETEETARKRMRTIKLFDHNGRVMSLERALELMQTALTELRARRLEVPRIEHCVELMQITQRLILDGYYQ